MEKEKIKCQIKVLRNELDECIAKDNFEACYAKSVELDKLIEKYIELDV